MMAATAARALIDILEPIRKLQEDPKDSYEEEEELEIDQELRGVFHQFAKADASHLSSTEFRHAMDELGLVTPETNREPDWLDPLKDGIDEEDFVEKGKFQISFQNRRSITKYCRVFQSARFCTFSYQTP